MIRSTRSRIVYADRWITLRVNRYVTPQGVKRYTVLERADAVVIIPVSPSRRTVLLEQWRYPTAGLSLEFPMGGVDPGESPEPAARRELTEETGIDASSMEELGSFRAVPGLTPQRVFVFIAPVAELELENVTYSRAGEDIRGNRVAGFGDLARLVRTGAISDALTLVAIVLASARHPTWFDWEI